MQSKRSAILSAQFVAAGDDDGRGKHSNTIMNLAVTFIIL